jgi:kynurenine formamidase
VSIQVVLNLEKTMMKHTVTALAGVVLAIAAGTVAAQGWRPPTEAQRCPSKWGANDERGSANHMKPETVLRATKLIRTGEVIELGHVLGPNMAMNPTRVYSMITKRSAQAPGANQRGGNEEIVTMELGQVGTQFDAFPHQMIANRIYNCVKIEDIESRTGFSKMGVEKVGMIFTRGVLIDVAALKGVEMLADNYEITAEDLQQALAKQKLTLQPGDAVIIHTGYGKLWGKDNPRYVRGNPGIGVGAAEWLVKQDPLLLGADTPPVEVSPNPDKQLSLPVHQIALVINGIHLLENMKLDVLAAKGVHEFALTMQPLKIQGGTGSTVAPAAIR